MQKPTGAEWSAWKKRQVRAIIKEGGTLPENWESYWRALNCCSSSSHSSDGKEQIRILQAEVARLKQKAVSHAMVREEILKLTKSRVETPGWLYSPNKGKGDSAGVPILALGDWHWGEVVDPSQIYGVNEYNLEIAHRRVDKIIGNTINILRGEFTRNKFPGIVVCLLGDMVSGDIHEELSRTNEEPIMEVFKDLLGVMKNALQSFADEFGKVFVPAVSGNHSRITNKPFAKDRNGLSFDWLLYTMLEEMFKDDDRITFMIPSGPECVFSVYGHRYCLTHGDQFRGGDGIIGHIGPVMRGNNKKRGRNGSIGLPYDTLILGHFHTLLQTPKIITNGSLIGFSEYAHANNFDFEPPQQALWITHPEHGITTSWPVFVEAKKKNPDYEWLRWPKEK